MPKSPFQKLDENVEESRFAAFDKNMAITRKIFQQIKENINLPNASSKMKSKKYDSDGRERKKIFTWQNSADQLWEVIENVLSNKK